MAETTRANDGTRGQRVLLDDMAAQRQYRQTASVTPPVLSIDPIPVPPGDAKGRALRQRIEALEAIVHHNYAAVEEARYALAAHHHRLEQESAARAHAQWETATLTREVERANQENERLLRQGKADAVREVRREFQREIDDLSEEVARLHGLLGGRDGLVKEYEQRVRDALASRAGLEALVEDERNRRREVEDAL
ncbi:MAG TPA: hypothetical protein VFR41_09215, partial [Acidimicrobiia bacterium]|nr:hypothetical protein [Acidimicrobiia bacterium]